MCCCSQKSATYFTVVVFFMLNGIEYAVIFPTLWLYIHERFHAQGYMMGVVVAAFSASGIIASPLIGKWADKSRNTKGILLFANLWEIAGNIMYLMGISTWFIVASRLVCGVGSGAGSAVIADISRGTTETERTSVLSKVMAARQFGLLIGPAFNFFLREFDFYIGSFRIDAYTAPGLFLACLWLLQQVQVTFMYFNLEKLHAQAKMEATAADIDYTITDSCQVPSAQATETASLINNACNSYGSINPGNQQQPGRGKVFENSTRAAANPPVISPDLTFSGSLDGSESENSGAGFYSNSLTDSSRNIESAERFMSTAQNCGAGRSDAYPNGDLPAGDRYITDTDHVNAQLTSTSHSSKLAGYINEFFREEIVLLLFLMFITFFNQVALETILTPLTRKFFGWAEQGNSILYSSCAVELLIVFAVVSRASRVVTDRTLIIFGVLAEFAGMTWDLIFIPSAKPGDDYLMIYFVVGVVLLLAGLPCLATATISLYSKLTSQHLQGVAHGFRRSVINISFIIGPLWGGAMLDRLQLLFAINTSLIVAVMIMVALSYRRLAAPNPLAETSTFTESGVQTAGAAEA